MYRVATLGHRANVVFFQVLSLYMALLNIILAVIILLPMLVDALEVGARSGIHKHDPSLPINNDHEVISHILKLALAGVSREIQQSCHTHSRVSYALCGSISDL